MLVPLAGLLLAGCNWTESTGGSVGGGGSAPPTSPQTRVDDSLFLARAAHVAEGEGQITLNNPWTGQDLADNEVAAVDWTPTDGPGFQSRNPGAEFRWKATTYTTLVSQYRERRKQCELDSQVTYNQRYPDGNWGSAGDEQICYPVLTDRLTGPIFGTCGPNFQNIRYGYWCGAGRPPLGVVRAEAPEPLDPGDFCCMLHDAAAWGLSTGTDNINERGIAMCMYMATEYPAGAMSRLPEVEKNRQCWHDWAAQIISGNQFDNPAPVVGR
jgi:hypothetical protein